MKPILSLTLFLLFLNSLPSQARRYNDYENQERHEFDAHFGVLSFQTLYNIFSYSGNQRAEYSGGGHTQTRTPYCYSLDYKYHIGRRISLGLALGMEYQTGSEMYPSPNNQYLKYGSNSGYQVGSYYVYIYTIAPEFTAYYARFHRFAIYGALAVGYSYEKWLTQYTPDYYNSAYRNGVNYLATTELHDHFNMNLAPIGFRWGGQFAGFLELGLGFKGLLNVGLSYKF